MYSTSAPEDTFLPEGLKSYIDADGTLHLYGRFGARESMFTDRPVIIDAGSQILLGEVTISAGKLEVQSGASFTADYRLAFPEGTNVQEAIKIAPDATLDYDGDIRLLSPQRMQDTLDGIQRVKKHEDSHPQAHSVSEEISVSNGDKALYRTPGGWKFDTITIEHKGPGRVVVDEHGHITDLTDSETGVTRVRVIEDGKTLMRIVSPPGMETSLQNTDDSLILPHATVYVGDTEFLPGTNLLETEAERFFATARSQNVRISS